MATHLGGMPPVYRLPRGFESPKTANEVSTTRLFGPKDAVVSAEPARGATDAAKQNFMNFLERYGGDYAKLTKLTGD